MTVDSVRRIADQEPFDNREDSIDAGNIEFDFLGIETKEPQVEEYPYDAARYLEGEFDYESEPLFGSPTQSHGTFQIRLDSQLAILQANKDRPKPEKIYDGLAAALQNDTARSAIEEDFQPSRKAVLKFIDSAAKWIDVRVLTPNGKLEKKGRGEIEDLEKYPIDRAKLRFRRNPEDGAPEEATVTYSDDQLRIHEGSPEMREFVIQKLETALWKANEDDD